MNSGKKRNFGEGPEKHLIPKGAIIPECLPAGGYGFDYFFMQKNNRENWNLRKNLNVTIKILK